MPSSLIIVALAAAWLVVLVPMVARKRQEVARTADSTLAARVVRSGSGRGEKREESAVSETAKVATEVIDDEEHAEPEPDDLGDEADREQIEKDRPAVASTEVRQPRQYRPGRGGFDPEAAELAARAKYAYRQRVVLGLLIGAVLSALVAGFVATMLWSLNGVIDAVLVGYLVYLRRQVRIEKEIRQRRLARFNSGRPRVDGPRRAPEDRPRAKEPTRPPQPVEDEPEPDTDTNADDTVVEARRTPAPRRRKATPSIRPNADAVVVDIEDEDPAFHELAEPGESPYRRAVGE